MKKTFDIQVFCTGDETSRLTETVQYIKHQNGVMFVTLLDGSVYQFPHANLVEVRTYDENSKEA